MKKFSYYLLSICLFLSATLMFSSCQVVGDIFKTGVVFGVIGVVLVVALIVWVVGKAGGSK